MTLIAVAGLAGLGAAAFAWRAWRHARLVGRPDTWPPNLTFSRQLSLTRAYLKQNGWTLLEPQPAWNIFIRAQKDNVGLSMMIHTEETLSLPTLMKDSVIVSGPTGLIIGILSQQTLPPDLQADAARAGIYVVAPSDLPDIVTHVRRAAVRQKKMREAAASQDTVALNAGQAFRADER